MSNYPDVKARDLNLVWEYQSDWNKYAIDVLVADLESEQQEILYAVQQNTRVLMRFGTARGGMTMLPVSWLYVSNFCSYHLMLFVKLQLVGKL